MSLLNALWASLTGQQQSGLGRRERNTIELIAKRFNKDADWQIGVVSALCAEPRGTRDYIFGTVSNATRQLELLNAVLRKHSPAAPASTAGAGGDTSGASRTAHQANQQGAAAGGPGLGGAAGRNELASAEPMREVIRAAVRETWQELAARQRLARKRKSFCEASSRDVDVLVHGAQLVEVRGEALAPQDVQVPAGTPECDSFVWEQGGGENAMTPALLQYHQTQLEKFGVSFDKPGGFKMNDTHNKGELIPFKCGEQSFSGGFDGCVAPYGLDPESIVYQSRIIYEHKRWEITATDKDQAIVQLLGAYAYNSCPVLLDLTNGQTHNIYTIRGTCIYLWKDLKPTQAYFLQARHLQAADHLRAALDLQLGQIPEEEQRTMRHVRQALAPAMIGGAAAPQ
ncbi:hypothetical protein CHLRE_09g412500v5 [Chlamydomonas reinhardtii]|uniref:Uncharacterized protein n=1 Tax=Chlamydomonas reinhardtii TaxID=3055 RepID=A0A2K3DFQ7_CHLRE|nr:uncharacterized protein CHLRE_09g412500v5 [Chlamydomonas reinhardtii]XP_042921595.1 uncharacterized protein CHLRE_09g412500v5 [Chlamydomonas reinhardtii]PNW79365.1 hypothetical protein CHLRE_09g412500v5 [Chlamydomonas reinhardtii]PNW79366.1 hypothetical protein CHLRE_09g412500v5 [Chlamydomonas reinhardtii]